MRTLKIFSVLLMALGLIGFMGGSSLVMADEVCTDCHSPDGAFDGVLTADAEHLATTIDGVLTIDGLQMAADDGGVVYMGGGMGDGGGCGKCQSRQSHDTHTNGIARGPEPLSCYDCHGSHCKKSFADGEPLATTVVCNNCHSPDGAFDGVGDLDPENSDSVAFGAKYNWTDGIYEEDGITLKSGKEKWCATCHDADQASSNPDGSGEQAPDISGNNTDYGYYITGHGLDIDNYPLMCYQGGIGNGNPGANHVCDDCHDFDADHISAGEELTRLKSGYENDQSNTNCNQCHPPGTSAIAPPELYTGSDDYEAAAHSAWLCTECHDVHGAVAGAYPAMAEGGCRDLCLSCHDGTTATAPSEPPSAHAASSDEACSNCHNPHAPAHGGNGGEGCEACHGQEEGSSHSTHTVEEVVNGPHIGCSDCHNTESYPDFADGATGDTALAHTTVCDNCHSEGGEFDGVQMAKANWADGVYDDGKLKSGNEYWCATCHDDVPASSRPGPGIEVVVDNPAAAFECEWGTSSSGGYNNGDYRWHAAGDASCTATWTPDLPAADNYNVRAWWKASTNRATDAKYTIYYDGGSETVEVDQQINGDKWNLLGTYPFAAGQSGYVVLTDDANGYVVADAIKLDNGSLDVSITAPNVIGDNVDYGFYVSGHKIKCLSCHDAGKQHIDHEHRTYDVDDATYAAINPYGDSYRLQVASNKASSTLCFVCHNSTEVLGASSSDVSHTNFWNNDASIANSHWLHVVSFTGIHFDSDWDGAIDSTESCITCHNVHGSPTQAMIRHSELISSYGTTDKIPALNFAYLVEPTEFDTASWTPDLAADTYSVYARWKASTNRATNAKYTIYYDGGSDTVEVNQQINGDQWNLLGTYPFAAGTSGYVELTDEGADNFVIADAIGWDTDGGAPDVVVDDGDAGFATVGDWTCISGSGGYGDDYCYAKAAPEPIPDAGVEDSVGGRMSYAGPGVAQNGVCHACHGAISYERPAYLGPRVIMGQAAPDTVVNDGSGTSLITVFVSDTSATGVADVDTVEIDLTPIGGSANQAMTDDGGGYYSYEVTIPDGTPDSPVTFVITATDDDMNTGEGEAKLTVVDPDSIYVDNAEAAFVCDWGISATGGYRDDYRWHAAGTGSCTATWTPGIPAADTYNVYAWWKASSNRATDAKYTIYYDGGSRTVEVNQEINDSQWNYLGNFSFAAGHSGYVVLSDDADEYVIADAIKLTPSPPPPPETVIVDNPDAQFVCTWGTSSTGGYNGDYRWHAAGTGSCTATWTPNLAAGASYGVYAWWVASPNRATDAPYTIYYDGGSMTVDVDQETNGDQWNLLGTFPFDAGTSGYVVLSDDANEYVVADAIKFEP